MLTILRIIELTLGLSILWVVGRRVGRLMIDLECCIYRNFNFGNSTLKSIAIIIGITLSISMMALGYILSKVLRYIFEGIIYIRL